MKVNPNRWRRLRFLTNSRKEIVGLVRLLVLVAVLCGVAQTLGRLGTANSKEDGVVTRKYTFLNQQGITNTTTNTTPNRPPKVKLYSRGRKDRAGAAILDMLLCHAFAFQENAIYGGVCIDKSEGKLVPYLEDQKSLTHALGLQEELPYACPTDRSGIIMRHEDYFNQDTEILTSTWISYIRSKRRKRIIIQSTDRPAILQVAIHVRRGDVTPCTEPERYLPNSYYLSVVDKYIVPLSLGRPINITIYSESASYEGWDPFLMRGYNLMLGSNVTRVWEALIAADVLVISRSSFSLVPALFNENIVLYTPFWHKPLGNWTIVPNDGADDETKRLRQGCA